MPSLANKLLEQFYKNLLAINQPHNLGIDNIKREIHDGNGTSLPWKMSRTQFEITVPLELSQAPGFAPLVVTSNTVVPNLNADLVDGKEASAFAELGGDVAFNDIDVGTLSSPDGLSTIITLDNAGTMEVDGEATFNDPVNCTDVATTTISSPDGNTVIATLANDGSIQFGGPANYLKIDADGHMTLHGDATVWDDIRITGAQFEFPGVADPNLVNYTLAAGGLSLKLYEFAPNDYVTFAVQVPHGYKPEGIITAHVHWMAGNRSTEEAGKDVRWELTYSAASINSVFPAGVAINMDDTVAGADDTHLMTSAASLVTTGLNISNMILCQLKRVLLGANDWASTNTGELPLFLEFDMHFEMDTVGSNDPAAK